MSYCYRETLDPDNRTPNTPAVLLSHRETSESIYRALSAIAPDRVGVDEWTYAPAQLEAFKEWAISKGWSEVAFHGKMCLLVAKVAVVPKVQPT